MTTWLPLYVPPLNVVKNYANISSKFREIRYLFYFYINIHYIIKNKINYISMKIKNKAYHTTSESTKQKKQTLVALRLLSNRII